MDDSTMKLGLLMESAQAHQKLAEAHLDRLRAHTEGLDGVVRDEIRRTFLEELRSLTAESRRAGEVLRKLRQASALRVLIWIAAAAIIGTGVPAGVLYWTLPSASEVAALSARRDAMAANLAALVKRGGRVEWRRCGEVARLCVRIDRKAPIYGAAGDFYIVAGY